MTLINNEIKGIVKVIRSFEGPWRVTQLSCSINEI